MRITALFTAEAEAAAQRYGILVEGWRSLYQAALSQTDFGSEKQLRRVEADAYAMASRFLDTEHELAADHSEAIALEALRATLSDLQSRDAVALTVAASEHLTNAVQYVTREVTIQVERDIAFLKESLRRTYLQVTIAARAQGITQRAALAQHRIGNAAELHFFFHDRGNQKWPSRKFIRAVWRHHLVSLYNEVVLLTLADHGLSKAEIDNANQGSHSHGMVIAMFAGSALPTYAEIRNEIFHPNSDAILKMAAPDVHS